MGSRRNIPPAYDERLRRGPLPPHPHHPREQIPLAVLLEDKLASQAAEIERLSRDNRTLASSHLVLRQDLVAAKREADKVRENIQSVQNEGDIEIRILLDKIEKLEADIRAGENLMKELEEARGEARDLETEKLELIAKIQQANIELENARANVKKLPEMHAQLEGLRSEHKRLRKTFEYEKGLNTKKVEEMRKSEKDLIALVEDVERLRAELIKAEPRASVSLPQGPYINSDNLYPSTHHGNSSCPDTSGGPYLHTIPEPTVDGAKPYAVGGFVVGPQITNGPVVEVAANAAVNPSWGRLKKVN
ncbi:Protein FLX-like 4 [Striga hermonthica]|uniref:Protein FLX-like 4 n=1 Tax=Striga hermonthica TaxID=68872 RepID=A0A9N7RM55_STRHE|nr:Protein FLX-like 4 [Striga hermonthica]